MRKDINQQSFETVGMLTGSIPRAKSLSSHLSKVGKMGGEARAKKLTASKRKSIAKKAANTRWAKK